MKRPKFKLPDEFGNEIPRHFLGLLHEMNIYSDFEGDASYTFFVEDGDIYFTPELHGKHKKDLYVGLTEMFKELCRQTIKHLQE